MQEDPIWVMSWPLDMENSEILVGRRSGPGREKCGPDRVICLVPDQ